MNYHKIYEDLIIRGQQRVLKDCYIEVHHIIPKCLGGSNDKSNLVKLTPEEHYVAHQLLVKLHPYHPGLICATFLMASAKHKGRTPNKLYGWLRKKAAELNSIRKTGQISPFKGKTHTAEAKAKNSASKMGCKGPNLGKPMSEEAKEKLSASKRGVPNPKNSRPCSEEKKAKISATKLRKKLEKLEAQNQKK